MEVNTMCSAITNPLNEASDRLKKWHCQEEGLTEKRT